VSETKNLRQVVNKNKKTCFKMRQVFRFGNRNR